MLCSTVQPLGIDGRRRHNLPWWLWPVAASLVGERAQKRLMVLGCWWRESGRFLQHYFPISDPCSCSAVGSGAPGDSNWLRQHAFWECAVAQPIHNQVHRSLVGHFPTTTTASTTTLSR
jgi:hypothetical protein